MRNPDQEHPDPYQVLGLSPGAEIEKVRQAFRRLAKRHHPDRPGGAPEHFRRIRAAYQSIIREKTSRSWERPISASKLIDPPTNRGRDLTLDLAIELEDVVGGVNTVVGYRRDQPCPSCRPTVKDGCPICLGTGIHSSAAELPLNLPPGLKEGLRLRFPGQGHYPPRPGFLPGDLYLIVLIKPHRLYKRDRLDLHLWWDPLNWSTGRADLVPTLTGVVRLPRPPKPGMTIRLPGQGLPDLDHSERGDLFLHY